MGMKPRMWFTSHSSPPVLWPVTRTSISAPSTRSDQSSTCTALFGSDSSYRPSSGLNRCTTTCTSAPGRGGTSNCRSETMPCWRPPNSTNTSSRRTATTRPLCSESGSSVSSSPSEELTPINSSSEVPSIARLSSSSSSGGSFSRRFGGGNAAGAAGGCSTLPFGSRLNEEPATLDGTSPALDEAAAAFDELSALDEASSPPNEAAAVEAVSAGAGRCAGLPLVGFFSACSSIGVQSRFGNARDKRPGRAASQSGYGGPPRPRTPLRSPRARRWASWWKVGRPRFHTLRPVGLVRSDQ